MKTTTLSTLLFITILLIAGCNNKQQQTDQQTTLTVPVYELSTLDTIVYNDYIADIQAIKNVEIRSRLKGFLEKIHVDEGSRVRKGQILFTISKDEYQSEVARADASLRNAIADAKTIELEAKRTRQLVEKNIISDSDLEVINAQLNAAESRVEEARSVLQQAQTRLAYTNIRSPFDGVIDRIPFKEGSLLDEGALLTSVSDLSIVYAYFDISEREYLDMALDSTINHKSLKKTVRLTLANGVTYNHEGIAEFAESEFESHTGSISLRAAFANPDGLLKHGSSGKINVPSQTGDTWVVHQKSVFEIQDRTYVYVLDNENKVKMTPFNAGQRVGHYYVVLGGLEPKSKIIFEGTQSLRDGMQITPKNI